MEPVDDTTFAPYTFDFSKAIQKVKNGQLPSSLDIDFILELLLKEHPIWDKQKRTLKGIKKRELNHILSVSSAELCGLIELGLALKKSVENGSNSENAHCYVAYLIGYLQAQAHFRATAPVFSSGVSQQDGRDKSIEKRTVTPEQWKERQAEAVEKMKVHDGNKRKVAKDLEITLSNLENWLRGGRR